MPPASSRTIFKVQIAEAGSCFKRRDTAQRFDGTFNGTQINVKGRVLCARSSKPFSSGPLADGKPNPTWVRRQPRGKNGVGFPRKRPRVSLGSGVPVLSIAAAPPTSISHKRELVLKFGRRRIPGETLAGGARDFLTDAVTGKEGRIVFVPTFMTWDTPR